MGDGHAECQMHAQASHTLPWRQVQPPELLTRYPSTCVMLLTPHHPDPACGAVHPLRWGQVQPLQALVRATRQPVAPQRGRLLGQAAQHDGRADARRRLTHRLRGAGTCGRG